MHCLWGRSWLLGGSKVYTNYFSPLYLIHFLNSSQILFVRPNDKFVFSWVNKMKFASTGERENSILFFAWLFITHREVGAMGKLSIKLFFIEIKSTMLHS